MSITVLVFILEYFEEKIMTTFFKKKFLVYFGTILVFFVQICTKINFPGGKGFVSVFKYSNYLPLCQKSEKIYRAILEENAELMERWTDRHKDGQITVIF